MYRRLSSLRPTHRRALHFITGRKLDSLRYITSYHLRNLWISLQVYYRETSSAASEVDLATIL
jgi:hypothetical protein